MTSITKRAATDLDETRRLLYMALYADRTEKYELVGTLVNALVHHSGLDLDADETAGHILDALSPDSLASLRGQGWLGEQIAAMTARLAAE